MRRWEEGFSYSGLHAPMLHPSCFLRQVSRPYNLLHPQFEECGVEVALQVGEPGSLFDYIFQGGEAEHIGCPGECLVGLFAIGGPTVSRRMSDEFSCPRRGRARVGCGRTREKRPRRKASCACSSEKPRGTSTRHSCRRGLDRPASPMPCRPCNPS